MSKDSDNSQELQDSRLLSFLDENQGILLHFFEAQKMISDVAITCELRPKAFSSYRDIVLSVQLLVSFLKDQSTFGFYVDSEEPKFAIKIETNSNGFTRCLCIPHDLDYLPDAVTGLARVVRESPNSKQTYTSIIELNKTPMREVVNKVMLESFQLDGRIQISDAVDQSLMLSRVPGQSKQKLIAQLIEEEGLGVNEYFFKHQIKINALLNQIYNNEQEIISAVKNNLGMVFLDSKPINFFCPCSKQRMVENLRNFIRTNPEPLFDPGQKQLEITCEYCRKVYAIKEIELVD
ncbi:MAG: Hsp33 family molecular chaperone HslO [Oligoflexales bacterium]|nr:Hsp33 family molecular chaperone HslO [Oligoflexales bacterium]